MDSLTSDSFRIGFVSASANQLRMEYYTRVGSASDDSEQLKAQARLMELQSEVRKGNANEAEQTLSDLRHALSALRKAKEGLEASRHLDAKA